MVSCIAYLKTSFITGTGSSKPSSGSGLLFIGVSRKEVLIYREGGENPAGTRDTSARLGPIHLLWDAFGNVCWFV